VTGTGDHKEIQLNQAARVTPNDTTVVTDVFSYKGNAKMHATPIKCARVTNRLKQDTYR